MDPDRPSWTHVFNYTDWQQTLLARMTRWAHRALCRDDPAFLYSAENPSDRGELGKAWRARQVVCLRCPVRDQCLKHALDFPEPYDVWGGFTPPQRAAMKKEQGGSDSDQ